VDGSKQLYAPDACHSVEKFWELFPAILKKSSILYYQMSDYLDIDEKMHDFIKAYKPNPRGGEKPLEELRKVQSVIGEMRLVKDSFEQGEMRKSAQISARAHREAMMATKPGLYEYQVEAEAEYWFHHQGSQSLAYSSIVAAGNNATILHYRTNRDQLRDGDLLLMDAGGEYNLYASDITRTWPINGKFTPAQKKIYELVLTANKDTIAMVKPGVKYADMHKHATKVLVDGLIGLGFLKGNADEIIKERKHIGFYPHGTGHWLGLDVHDAGEYLLPNGEPRPLEAGHVFTVEPGIYIPADNMDVPAEFRGIGVRIEDDILVTPTGHEILTIDTPKEIAELEAIVGTKAKN
jgi:Xaa-Pro aminopeptidase